MTALAFTRAHLRSTTCTLISFLIFGALASAQTYTVINTFSGANGSRPVAGVILDSAGNVYGTTSQGGNGQGTVFQLTPAAGGTYTETVLYTFGAQNDGVQPSAGLVLDSSGNLYGTTESGGAYNGGTVFELSRGANGWTETILHSFGNGTDGVDPKAALTIDSAGNLFGTTYQGGTIKTCLYAGSAYSCGTVFELTPSGNSWTYRVIHNFGSTHDGYFPVSGVTLDTAGNLYGECLYGSEYGKGTLYELKLVKGLWTEQLLHPWGNKDDGTFPFAGMVFDSTGYMYGASSGGGGHGGLGTIFAFTPNGTGWMEHNLHGFGTGLDGQFSDSTLIVDSTGNLYGVTLNGGAYGYGMVFELNYSALHGYSETVLHNFTGGADGAMSTATLAMDSSGNLFGTTWYGGSATNCVAGPFPGCGVAFKISPPAASKGTK